MAVACPKCGSEQFTAQKKGFSAGRAIAGDVLFGPLGIAAGIANQHNIIITCLACGNTWRPGNRQPRGIPRWPFQALLWLGIVFMPYVFAWFTFGKSHGTTARAIAFGWLAIITAMIVLSR